MLGPGFHVRRRYRVASGVGDEVGLAVRRDATSYGVEPTGISAGFLVLVFTSIVDSVPSLVLVTKAFLPSGVNSTRFGPEPTGISVGFLVLVFTSIVDTVPSLVLVTNAVFPFGVTATPNGSGPTGVSVRCFVLVVTSIVDTEGVGDKGGRPTPPPSWHRHPVRGRAYERARQPEHHNPTHPPHHCPCLAIRLGHRRHGVTAT